MKINRVNIKVIFIVAIISVLSYSSCDVFKYIFNCKTCSTSGQKDVEVCGQHEIDEYENSGWDCK
jgi:hypothetical protein